MAATWPVSLPPALSLSGYREGPPNNALRTEMDVGPAKVRRRHTAAVRAVRGTLVLTTAQVETLDAFYLTTLNDGVDLFDWDHPRTAVASEFRFVKPPAYDQRDKGSWIATLELEILP